MKAFPALMLFHLSAFFHPLHFQKTRRCGIVEKHLAGLCQSPKKTKLLWDFFEPAFTPLHAITQEFGTLFNISDLFSPEVIHGEHVKVLSPGA
jgi:hypothetical protein